jgi:desulfoferrodoxin (superoxide reductase-like protein)
MGVELLSPETRYLELLNSIRKDNIKNEKSEKRKTGSFICKACNYIAFEQAPTVCPFCRSSIDHFENNPDFLKTLDDFDYIGDFEKKHFPVVTLAKEYDSKRESRFTDVHVKAGEIAHSMDIDDHIKFMDFYLNEFDLNKKCISRFHLNCKRLKPEGTIRINNATSGVLTVVNNCSAHGSWMTEVKF